MESARGRPDEALVSFKHARRIQDALVKGHPDVAQFGRELAQTHHDIGRAHQKAGRLEEALVGYAQGRALWDDLVKRNRDNLWYRSRRAEVWIDIGAALAEQDRREEAVAAYGSGIDDLRAALGKAAGEAGYRQSLGQLYQDLARWLRKWRQPEAAADLARQRRDLWPKDPAQLVSVAADHAQCGPLVGDGKADLTAQEQAQRQRYADEAVVLLRQAVEMGYRDSEHLRKDPGLESLRMRGDFRELLDRTEAAAKTPGRK